ncbi:MAG: hypothetical protein NT175_03995 [Bacteroidetes bacterium]|nr:hypothetical protein [Bacteroidota bacterium]
MGGEEISFPLTDYSGKIVQLKFRTWGPTTDAWIGLYVSDLKISSYFDNDLSALNIEGPHNVSINQSGIWILTVKNSGLLPQSGFSVKLFSARTNEEG